MQMIHYFMATINRQTIIVTLLSLISVSLSLHYKVTADLPISLIGIAIVFPIVFSINASYKRREEALRYFAEFKATIVAIYFAHRDWGTPDGDNNAIQQLLIKIFRQCHAHFSETTTNQKSKEEMYQLFSQLSHSITLLSKNQQVAATETSRINQYLRSLIIGFEQMDNILVYRTPKSLRAYSSIFLNSFPILFAPYFASFSEKYFFASGFLLAIFYTTVLVSLDNIQELLENPFDQLGVDDINLDITTQYQTVLTS